MSSGLHDLIPASNGGYKFFAAMPDGDMVDGMPAYIVAGDDGNGNAVTWRLNTSNNSFYWGHYFHRSQTLKTANERALVDMVKRAGISPADLELHHSEV